MSDSDKKLDEIAEFVDKLKPSKSSDEKRLKKLRDKKDKSVDEKMELDRLSEHVSEKKRQKEFEEGWSNMGKPMKLGDD